MTTMKKRIFLPSSETLLEALPYILPNSDPLLCSFRQLSKLIPEHI